jgi:hypothetical protein
MNQHPAKTMLSVWGLCLAAFAFLPYQLLDRDLTAHGLMVLAIFIGFYLVGTFLVPTRQQASSTAPSISIDATKAETWLMVVTFFANVFFILDAKDKNIFDLVLAYELRSAAADALLKADTSTSSLWFQLAFLFYPAGYVFIAVHGLYAPKVQTWKITVFGLLPIILGTLSMGGRNPIFYALIVVWLVFRERRKMEHINIKNKKISNRRKWFLRITWLVILVVLFQFFIAIFMVRAGVAGGASDMFLHAEQVWGVGFRGPLSEIIFAIFGEDIAYFIFIFSWYLVQGFVISNYLFSAYDGPLQIGAYGIDLLTAFMRRLDPDRLAEGFNFLLTLGTYGFLPSAWGSLYVDFGFFGIVFCVVWGAFTALCYRRIVVQRRKDWLLIGPFVSIGIIFSVINTPLGFTNGFVTHSWLLGAFLLLKCHKVNAMSLLIHSQGKQT